MKKLLVSILSMCLMAFAGAVTVIELSWMDGRTVADALTPSLRHGETVSGMDNKLILDASPARVRELTAIARQLDQKPQNLQVEVEQTSAKKSWFDNINIGIGFGSGHFGIGGSTNLGGGGSQVGVGAGSDHAGVGVSTGVGSGSNTSRSVQTLRILSGGSGYIKTGNSRPLPWVAVTQNGDVIRGNDQQEAITGFYVRPRLVGDRVLIDLTTRQEAFKKAGVDSSGLATTVEGGTGQWITIGGVVKDTDGKERVLLGVANKQQALSSQVRVRVSVLP